jgi:DNA-binding NarL/FixJ family response regulator
MIKILLVDDHKIIRDGIKSLLKEEADIQVIGEASNGRELIDMLPKVEVDVILMDINMPVMDGFETTKYVTANCPDIKVLVLSMLDHENYISRMMEVGALGYLLKNTGRDELLHAIKMVASGNTYICSDIAINLLKIINDGSVPKVEEPQPNLEKTTNTELSKREIEVLKLIAEGFTNAEIADKLFTSKRTIESHRQKLIEKTHAKNTAALIKYAISKGLIS